MKFFLNRETSEPIKEEKKELCFYIPIVEQIRESVPNWDLAKQENRIRKFYSSAESLQQAESARIAPPSLLACYKVMLTDTERQELTAANSQNSVYRGCLNFNRTEILSLILFKSENQLELENPHYHHETPTDTAACCA
ncbi:hypothetical protein BN59_01145 [Legionella massiliensis]|uniref:Uncharacterized protein n=1 Tax=Legionella massiliensis TaxID=1034943 RepID=A0A078KYL8_9GAMM|nr:hypothetical protein [Legionella massiliensis]CDZ76869.1 hypothetical protein BN59_01145 [Legionella massiliensis]CEE12607.1 hypothetical protein BN1094_01145 [Legionella massiliensis]